MAYLPSGNPMTLESMVYGVAAACRIVSVISWFSCYNAVMTSDKFIYLFGRIIPALSLIFSMVLRFVPKFKAQITVVSNAQKCVGRDVSNGGIIQRAKHGLTILSIMVTWALENAIETADSMKSRGYGRPGGRYFQSLRLIFGIKRRCLQSVQPGFTPLAAQRWEIFASKYTCYLPNKEELIKQVESAMKEIGDTSEE